VNAAAFDDVSSAALLSVAVVPLPVDVGTRNVSRPPTVVASTGCEASGTVIE
jgi:hypothetical protein